MNRSDQFEKTYDATAVYRESEMTSGEDCLTLQEALSLLAYGTTADPAAWREWMRRAEKARQGAVDANLVMIPKPNSRWLMTPI